MSVRTRKLQVALCVVASVMSGCGPAVGPMLAGNHFREATCAVDAARGSDATQGASDEARDVSVAITRALDPQLHVDVLSDEAVAAAAPAAPSDVRARVLFVRVRVVTNDIPVDHLGLSVNTSGDAPSHPMDLEALAKLTSERAPASHTRTETHYLDNIVSGAVTIFTLGLIDPGHRGPTTSVVPAEPFEWEESAPNAHSLYTAFTGSGCAPHRSGPDDAPHVGMACDATFLVERAAAGSLALDLGVEYRALRLSRTPDLRDDAAEATWTCRLKTRVRVPLGPVRELPHATAAAFGPRFRAVQELAKGAGREVVQ